MMYDFTYNGRLYCFNEDCDYHKGTYICPLMIMKYFACNGKVGLEYEVIEDGKSSIYYLLDN